MASIATLTYLDGGTARTAGETWTISSGGKLIVRTDTRWHANAPAAMTGTMGSTTIANNASILYDGSTVRWMPFDTGTGNVPAIGTTITQGGVSGYFLGVWATYTSAPTAVGAAMPATGFIKFREVTGGPYSAGALTGIGANATSPDVAGWIEVVYDTAATITNNVIFGIGVEATGDWFYLADTSGTAGQIIPTPTNGAGALTRVSGVQIETAPGSGQYEWWTGAYTTPWTLATTRPTTDARSRMYQVLDNGEIRIGSDGTSNVGYTPVAGCKIRMPNIFFRIANTATRSTTASPNSSILSNTRFIGGGSYSFSKCSGDISYYMLNCRDVTMSDVAFATKIDTTGSVGSVDLRSMCKGDSTAVWTYTAYEFAGNFGSVNLENLTSLAYSSGSIPYNFSTTKNVVARNITHYEVPSSIASINPITWTSPVNLDIDGLYLRGKTLSINNGINVKIKNYDYIERLSGATTTTGSGSMLNLTNCFGAYVELLTWGNKGMFANTHPRASSAIITISGGGHSYFIRNIGSKTNILDTGSTANTRPNYIVGVSGNTGNTEFVSKIQRIFVNNVQGLALSILSTVVNFVCEQIYDSKAAISDWPLGQNCELKACRSLNNQPSGALTTHSGTNYADFFNSDTTGRIGVFTTNISTKSASYATTNFTTDNSGIKSGVTYLPAIGDSIELECPYFIKGHTGFANTAISYTVSATGNFLFQYQVDSGSGWGGTWKTLTVANLLTETISATGFKVKVKITAVVANAANTFTNLFIATTSTLAAQFIDLYPLDVATLGFTGLIPGSEVRVYDGTDPATAVEIGGTESVGGSTFSFTHTSGGQPGVIVILAMGYQPIYLPYTFKTTDDSILIQPVVDRNYVNPV